VKVKTFFSAPLTLFFRAAP